MYKPFSQELYNECNDISISVAVDLLTGLQNGKLYRLDVPLTQQLEAYKSHDFMITWIENNSKIYVEVEKKNVWTKSGKWQGFNSVDVAYRKMDSKADLFIMINKHNDTLAITTMENVKMSPIETKETIYTTDERFFKVALNNFKFYCNSFGKWHEFKLLNK